MKRFLIFASLTFTSCQTPNHSNLEAVRTNADGIVYVDTHDDYDHASLTSRIDLTKFNYFVQKDGRNSLALTFDCAWVEPTNALDILDKLKQHGIKLTFFIAGPFVFPDTKLRQVMSDPSNVERYIKTDEKTLKIIRRMVDDGHEFGNHSVTHPHNSASVNWVPELNNLERGWDAITKKAYNGNPPSNAKMLSYWRAPYGEYDDRSLRQAAQAGYRFHFGWNVDTLDSAGRADWTAGKMSKRVIEVGEVNRFAVPAIVVLAHLQNPYFWGRDQGDGLEKVIQTYKAKGYGFAKLSEIFAYQPDGTHRRSATGRVDPPEIFVQPR